MTKGEIQKLNKLQVKFNKILKNFLQLGHLDPKLIIRDYQDLKNLKEKIRPLTKPYLVNLKNNFNYPDFKDLSKKYSAIHFLQKQINKRLSEYVDYFLVHGSFATKDFLENWSDLDTLIILNDKTFESVADLKYVRKWIIKLFLVCYKIDPLAHHRFFFLTEFDLGYYAQFLFPVILYDYAVCLYAKNNKLELKIRDDYNERVRILSDFVKYFETKIESKKYSDNLYDWKNDISHILLFPTLMLQAKNIHIYKKYSFKRIKEEFPGFDFSVVEKASRIRTQWRTVNLLGYYPNFLFFFFPASVNKFIIDRYRHLLMRIPPKQSKKEIRFITNKALELFKRTLFIIGEQKYGK